MVRLVSYSTYALLVATMILLALSDISELRWAGVLLALFLGDRLIHIHDGEKTIAEAEALIEKKKKINLALLLTSASYRTITYSFRKSRVLKNNFYLTTLKKLLSRKDIKEALRRLSVDVGEFSVRLDEYNKETVKMGCNELLSLVADLVEGAYLAAEETGEKFIEQRSIFVALAHTEDSSVKKLLEFFNVSAADLKEAVIFGRYHTMLAKTRRTPAVLGGFAHRPVFARKRIMNRAWTARPTTYLDQFGTDLTALARAEKVGFLVGHKKEFGNMLNILSRPAQPNVLLVGEPGTGKSTMIAHLAFRIIKDKVPKVLFDKRLISLDIGGLIADASVEELAGRLKRIAEEIITAGNIVLFIPNIHNLFKSIGGDEYAFNIMDVFLPVIKDNAIPVIGETYPREFKQYIRDRSDFLEQFETVKIEEVSREEAVRILTYQSLIFENQFKVFITLRAVKKAVFLGYRYLHHRPLPSGAIDLLKQALTRTKQRGDTVLDEDIIIEVAQDLSRIPIQQAEGEELDRLLNMEKLIHKRLINQEAAVGAVSRALREYRSGLSRRGGPIAAFLFVGPTGVGKTELAKILTEIQFGDRSLMERFDMSEYQDKQSIFRFIGTPDGKRTGALTDAVLERPYSVILLDEFEKAHPDILNLFLQVFDDGRLTDSLGRTVNFENTIIIATSNAHSNFIKEEVESGKKVEEIAEEFKGKLATFFKPELLNRFSDIIVFRNLEPKEIDVIAKILVKEVSDQLKDTHGIDLLVEDSAVKKISEIGYSNVFGARPLRGAISENLRSVLAEKILRKEVARGNVIHVSYDGDGFRFKIVE